MTHSCCTLWCVLGTAFVYIIKKKKKKKASSLSSTKHVEHMSFLTFAKTIRNILNRALFTTMFASSEPFSSRSVWTRCCSSLQPNATRWRSKKSDSSGRSVYHLCAQYHKNRDTLVETLLHSDVQWPLFFSFFFIVLTYFWDQNSTGYLSNLSCKDGASLYVGEVSRK